MSKSNFRFQSIPAAFAILAIGVLLGQSACVFLDSSGSFSDSSGSISDSSGSGSQSSESSSESSGGGNDSAFRDDVRDFTSALASAEGSPSALRRGLTELALGRGISDWEAVGATYSAVGEGLALAGVTEDRLGDYQAAIARHGSLGFEAIGTGYSTASR